MKSYGETTTFECSGVQKVYNTSTRKKLPAIVYTRVFRFDDDKKSVSEYLDNTWTLLDADAEVDKTDISARYSRDYPDARIDVIFEFNRADNSLVYLLDIDERPGEFFTAHCQTVPG